jgi:hypothetical protein
VEKLITVWVGLCLACIALTASTAQAQQPPTPEQVQTWATALPRQPTSLLDPVYSPIDVIHVLDRTYSVMLQDFSQGSPGDAWTKAGEGSKVVDHFRRLLVHSPDNSLNRLTNTALNQVGDVFDEVNATNTRQAALKAPASNLLWARIEATLKQYGVDTGEPWTLSTAK